MNRLLLVGAALLLPGVVAAQATLSPDLLNRLPTNQVTELDGQIYVRVMDQRRGATQALERLLINRATAMAGHWLCNFSPKPNQRLEVSLQGVNLIHSHESSGSMEVVIRLKKQKPDCVVQTVASSPPPVAATAVPQAPPETTSPSASALPSLPNASPPPASPAPSTDANGGGFKVRAYSKEY